MMFKEFEPSHLWQIPSKCTDDRIRELSSITEDGLVFDLSKQENRDFLFREFCKIRSLEDAARWRSNVGALYSGISSREDIFKLSKTVQWVAKFYQELRDENFRFLRKRLEHESVLQRRISPYTESEFEAMEERVLAALENKTPTESGELIGYLGVWLAAEEPERVLVWFSPPQGLGIGPALPYIGGSRFGSFGSGCVFELPIWELEEEFENIDALSDNLTLKKYAFRYLHRVLVSLFANLRATIRLHQAMDGYAYFQQGFECNSPWEAIVSVLIKLVSRNAPPRSCSNPACDKTFIAARSDQKYCGRPGCRKAVSRQRKILKNANAHIAE